MIAAGWSDEVTKMTAGGRRRSDEAVRRIRDQSACRIERTARVRAFSSWCALAMLAGGISLAALEAHEKRVPALVQVPSAPPARVLMIQAPSDQPVPFCSPLTPECGEPLDARDNVFVPKKPGKPQLDPPLLAD